MLTWIFFDVGGTLFDEEPVYQFQEEVILTLLNKNGCQISDREFASAVRAARRHYLPSYVTHLIWIFTEEPPLFEKVKREYEKKMNATSYKRYAQTVTLLPGMKDLVMDLSGRYNLGIIGNQPAVVRRRLEEENLIDVFKVHAISGEMGMRKPDLRFFLGALSIAQCEPSSSVMVGDRLDNDVFPSRMLGMTSVRLKVGPHRHQPVLSPEYLPHYTVTSTRALGKLLLADDFVSRSTGPELVM